MRAPARAPIAATPPALPRALQLLEEAQELSEATDPDDVAAEAADLIYFTLVSGVAGSPQCRQRRVDASLHSAAAACTPAHHSLQVSCVRAGVRLSDIESHLDRRALKVRRRAGDAKSARIAAADAHFKAVALAAAEASAAPRAK